MIDPNVYALQISLAMDTMQAEQSLDQFGESLTAIEDNISSSATKAFSSIEKVISGINDGLTDISKYATMSLGDMEEELKKLQKKDKMNDEFDDFMEKESDFFKEMIESLDTVIKSLKLKNLGHKDELGYIEQEVVAVGNVAQGIDRTRANAELTSRIFQKILRTIQQIGKAVIASDEAAEQFVTTNWRAYGTQQMLAQEVRGLVMEYGLLKDEAQAAMVMMGTMKVPRDELAKYAKTVASANRYMGAGVDTLGHYSLRMRQVGGDSESLEKHFHKLAGLMYKFKLSAEDMNRVLSDTSMSASMIKTIFKPVGDGDAAEQYTELKAAWVGLAGSAGYLSDEALTLATSLNEPISRMKFAYKAGMASIDNMDQMAAAQYRVGKSVDALRERYRKMGMSSSEIQISLDKEAKAYGMADHKQMEMVADMYIQAKAQGMVIETLEDLTAVTEAYKKQALDPLLPANRTLTRQVQILGSTLLAIMHYAIEPLRYALMWLVLSLNIVIQYVGAAVKAFGDFWAWLESWPVIGLVFKWTKFLAGALGLLVIGIVAATIAFAGLAISFGGVAGIFKGALTFIRIFTTAMLQLATAVGKVIIILLTSIGKGLAALGKAVMPVMVPLLAVGAALMMAGLGAYFFAKGVSTLMELGWQQAVVGILLMVAAIGILGLVLVGLAYLAAPVAPVLLILGLTFLMIGAAAWLMGAGLLMASQSLEAVAEFGSQISLGTWLKLAAGIALVGAAGLIAGPGLMMAGLGLLMIGAAAMLAAKALVIIMEAMKKFGTEIIVNIAKAIDIAVKYLLSAALALVPIGFLLGIAAVGLGIGAIALAVAMPLLIASAVLLAIAGVAIVVGGALLATGAVLIFASAVALFASGLMIFIGAGLMMMGAQALLPASLAIAASAIVLAVAVVPLMLAATALIPTAIAIGAAGAALIAGGFWLRMGAWSISGPARSIYEAGRQIGFGAWSLGRGATNLAEGVALVDDAIESINKVDVDILEEFAEDLAGISSDFADNFEKAFGELKRIDDIEFTGDAIFKLTDTLNKVSGRMQESVTMFKKPADELVTVLQSLGDAVVGFGGIGDKLGDDLDDLISTLDSYVVQLDAVTERIEAAIETKALPAVRAAERAGIQEAIKSEAITSVEVLSPAMADNREQSKMTVLLEEQNGLLKSVVDVLGGLGSDEVTKIKELLESHLNAVVVSGSGGLSSDLNRWTS